MKKQKRINMEEKRIEIPCNKKVRDYTVNNLKKLCGLTVSRAYEKFIEKGAISVEESLAPDNRIEQLIKLINRFTIPKSVPVRPVDKRHMEQFRERWKKHLESLPVNNAADSKPVYLIDAVNRILKRRKSRIQCTRIHLMWHLDLQGEDHMIPEEIATAITKFGLSDWSDVRPLIDNSQYNIRIRGNGTKEIEQEEFLKAIEFIYQIPNFHVDEGMKEKILNDIKVLQDFLKDKEKDPETYDYEAVWKKYTAKLQTAPASRKRKSDAKRKVKTAKEEKAGESSKEGEITMTEETTVPTVQPQGEVTVGQEESLPESAREGMTMQSSGMTYVAIQNKIMRGEPLNESDQLYLIRVKHECPSCGHQMAEHTSQIGRKYVSCDCQYYAPGTFENPTIDSKYKAGVIRRQRP